MKAEGGRLKGEGGRRKAEGGRRRAERLWRRAAGSVGRPAVDTRCSVLSTPYSVLRTRHSVLTTGPSPFSNQHSAFSISLRLRAGVSLLEVLISMFVLSIGLLGMAALIPVGKFAIDQTGKADRSGACGHAALSEIKVRRMLDPYPWPDFPDQPQWVYANGNDAVPAAFAAGSFAIDPLGVARGMPVNLGGATIGSVVPRITLKSVPNGPAMTFEQAERVFRWQDDLIFSLPEDMEPPPAGDSDRPRPADPSGVPQAAGKYSWLVTVTPAAAEADLPVADRTLFSVSVAVCHGRSFAISEFSGLPVGEYATTTVEFLGSGYGGGSVRLTWPPPDPRDPLLKLREREWIMLSGGRQCKWYRIVSADRESPPSLLTLAGPDWDRTDSPNPTAVAIDHVVGVYTTTVELDSSLLRMR